MTLRSSLSNIRRKQKALWRWFGRTENSGKEERERRRNRCCLSLNRREEEETRHLLCREPLKLQFTAEKNAGQQPLLSGLMLSEPSLYFLLEDVMRKDISHLCSFFFLYLFPFCFVFLLFSRNYYDSSRRQATTWQRGLITRKKRWNGRVSVGDLILVISPA